jgi:transcription-repair coupling factor (superfamily II helicase)
VGIESAFSELSSRVTSRRSTRVHGARGLGFAHTLAKLSETRPVVCVARSETAADDLRRDLRALFQDDAAVLRLPADDRTPYHKSSPDPLVVMERAATLYKVSTGVAFRALVLSPRALARRMLPFGEWNERATLLAVGEEVERDELLRSLVDGGYAQVNFVEDRGTFAIRGSIIDVFWPGLPLPFRIDLFGDEIESIKLFDPESQRTKDALEDISFGPAREVHLTDANVRRAKPRLRDLADDLEHPTKAVRALLEDLENQIPVFGVEGLLPALAPDLELPLELVKRALGVEGFTLALEDAPSVERAVSDNATDFISQHQSAAARGDLCFPPETHLAEMDEVRAGFEGACLVDFRDLGVDGEDVVELRLQPTSELRSEILRETMRKDDDAGALLRPLADKVRALHRDGRTVLMPVASLGGVDRIRELLRAHHLEVRKLGEPPDLLDEAANKGRFARAVHAWTYVAKPPPARGADLPHAGITVIAEDEIFGKRARRSGSTGKKKGFKTSLSDLEDGDFIVHVDFGVGKFHGLTRLSVKGVEQDYVLLTYHGDDKLYLPVHRLNLIQRFAGPDGKPPRLDKLGGTTWTTKRTKVKKAVLAIAQELLELYAKRELAKRPAFPEPDTHYWEFESRFPFEATPDQQKAIDDVVSDMSSDKPMDRLVCGDVGYGKTEVGMRAAMMAVLGGKQVAVLAPTTVLAQQHYLTFTERFEGTGANIEVISRFNKAKDTKDILKRAAEGKLDVLIGTHRLLSNDVHFDKLGLVVVDEEQRFGVKAKEKLKRLRASADVLTMTATPIPRTLQMGFFGLRDLSVIETPPVDRLAIRTSVIRFDDDLIREALMRELSRGGQVYFVHNRVRSIAATADYIKRLVPEARVGVGHGQMDADTLEGVMLQFMNHEINVLVCTAIIETGIDVPTANTMFIDHADEFGLAQLYQLRGRIGRSKERAFAYLVIPTSEERLTPDARKRLELLQRFSELGAGFQVAQHDLELRGAGDLLGKSQHGHVTAVGYDMYAALLKEAVEELRGRAHDDAPDPDIKLPVAALVPEKYVADLHERLSFYQKLATAKDAQEVYDTVGTFADLHGDPPAEVTALADLMVLKQRLREMAARALEIAVQPEGTPDDAPPKIVLTLGEGARLKGDRLLEWVAKDPEHARLTPNMKLIYTPTKEEWLHAGHELMAQCRVLLRRLLDDVGVEPRT